MTLDPQQRAAVESPARKQVVIAGPGSGKTRVLVERIKWLVNNGAAPACMTVMTFTNAAAYELRERLGGLKLSYLGTLHGYCYRLLQRHGSAVGYREGGINMLSQEQTDTMLDEAADRMHWKGSDKALREARCALSKLIHKEHQHTMKRHNMVDYDGVLRDALALLGKLGDDTHRDLHFELPSYLFVDERQDSAEIDGDIYEAMGAEYQFHAGDTDQGIFSFRGASPLAFLRFAQKEHPIMLEWNYRSGTEICEAANNLIANNAQRIPKSTIPAVAFPCNVTVRTFDTCLMERAGLAMTIGLNISTSEWQAKDVAVLCRTNDIATKMRDAMEGYGIPVTKTKAADNPLDWTHAMNVLKLFNDPRNDIVTEWVLREILQDPNGTGGTIRVLKKRATESGRWLCDVAATVNAIPPVVVWELSTLVERLPRWMIGKESVDLIAQRIRNLPQGTPTLPDLIHDLYQVNRSEQESEGVTVTTIHAAKGREWPIVFLPAWEEGVLPQEKKDTDLEEERRLAFVAITRAMTEVHISWARERSGEWKTVQPQPSRFIAECNLHP